MHFRVSNANDGGGNGEAQANAGRRYRVKIDPCCVGFKEMNLLLTEFKEGNTFDIQTREIDNLQFQCDLVRAEWYYSVSSNPEH